MTFCELENEIVGREKWKLADSLMNYKELSEVSKMGEGCDREWNHHSTL